MDHFGYYPPPERKPSSASFGNGDIRPVLTRLLVIAFDILLIAVILYFREWVLRAVAKVIRRFVPVLVLLLLLLIAFVVFQMRRGPRDRSGRRG